MESVSPARMETIILHQLVLYRPLGYAVVFIDMFFMGDLSVFTAAFLAHRGFFDPAAVAGISFAGALCGDAAWYWFGRRTSLAPVMRWVGKLIGPFDGHLHRRPSRTLFIGRFTYGVYHALLLHAGAEKIPYKDVIVGGVPSALVWIAVIGGLGYFSSASFSLVRHYVRFVEIALLIALLAFVIVSHMVAERLRKRL